MVTIHSMIKAECVFINPDVSGKEDLFRLMAEGLASSAGIGDSRQLLEDILSREALSPTALGYGCAVPHALSSAADKTVMAAAVFGKGLDFSAPDGEPVRIVIMMAGPGDGARMHLKLLSKLARFLHNPEFREALAAADTAEGFLDVFREKEV